MSHVDEGALHAYLDGALDEYPAAEAKWVREHLEICASCREALEVERELRSQAASILGFAAPEVAVPSFEELRAYVRANAPKPSPISVRIYRLGWAASVVLALGTGWMLRGGQVSVTSPTGVRLEEARQQEAPASSDAAENDSAELERTVEETPAGAVGQFAQEPQGARADAAEPVRQEAAVAPVRELSRPSLAAAPSEPSAGAGGAGAPSADADDVPMVTAEVAEPAGTRLDESVVSRPDRLRTEAQAPGVPSEPAPEVVAAEPRAAREQVADAARVSAAVEPERRATQADVVTSANVSAPSAGLAPLGRSVEFGDTRDELAEDQESYSLVVPGLEPLDFRFRGSGVRSEGQVVLQRLASGDTLEVIHLPPEIDPSSLDDLTPGDTELVVQRAAGWIVMRAPVSEEELLELLERLLAER